MNEALLYKSNQKKHTIDQNRLTIDLNETLHTILPTRKKSESVVK